VASFTSQTPMLAGNFGLAEGRCPMWKERQATMNSNPAAKRGAVSPRGIRSLTGSESALSADWNCPLDRCDHGHMQSCRDQRVLAQTSSSLWCPEITLHRPILWNFSIRKLLRSYARCGSGIVAAQRIDDEDTSAGPPAHALTQAILLTDPDLAIVGTLTKRRTSYRASHWESLIPSVSS
jgi:hypothetical protein